MMVSGRCKPSQTRNLGSSSVRAAPRKGGVLRDGYRPFGSLTVLRAVNEEKALEK